MAKKPTPKPKPRPRPKPRPKPKDDCFITTACVEYFGYADNSSKLQLLRFFRDNYLQKSIRGKKLVKFYYSIAPVIVQRLKKDKNSSSVFNYILKNINGACIAIKRRNNALATEIYTDVVQTLGMYYRII